MSNAAKISNAAQNVGNALDAATSFQGPSAAWRAYRALIGTDPRTLAVEETQLTGKWIIISGGNNGIGREAALQFAKWGASIILACRDPPPTEIHPEAVVKECFKVAQDASHTHSTFEWWTCDMTDLSNVKAVGERWLATDRPLDILVNNAGISDRHGPPVLTKDGFEILHQVNFLSHTLLTMTLLPSLAKAPSARITCTTSCMQYFGVFDLANANTGDNAYSNNKLYFQTWLTEFQHRCLQNDKYNRIVIQGVHPGYVKTGIWTTDKTRKQMSWLQWGLNVLLDHVGIDAQQGSLTITHAATNPQYTPTTAEEGGKLGGGRYFNRTYEGVAMPQTKDPKARQAVWTFVDKELRSTKLGNLSALA